MEYDDDNLDRAVEPEPSLEDEEWERECRRHGVDVRRMKKMDQFFDEMLNDRGDD
jgi:hypothetical protein